jgi:hypothetical protein
MFNQEMFNQEMFSKISQAVLERFIVLLARPAQLLFNVSELFRILQLIAQAISHSLCSATLVVLNNSRTMSQSTGIPLVIAA